MTKHVARSEIAATQALEGILSGFVDQIAARVRSKLIEELPTLLSAKPQHDSEPQADFYTERDLEARFAIKRKTLQSWRLDGKGPPWRKVERLVRYPVKDANKFFGST